MNNVFAMGACRIQQAIQTLGYPINEYWYYTHGRTIIAQEFKKIIERTIGSL